MKDIVGIILAAGRGKRMQPGQKSRQKVLAELQKKPMLGHVLEVVSAVGVRRVIVVVGHQAERVESYLEKWRKRLTVDIVKQKKLLGTADAVRQTEKLLKDYQGDVLILYGDTPLLTEGTLRNLLAAHRAQKNYCTLLTTLLKDPTGYGRIVRNGRSDTVEKIVEEVDTIPKEKAVREINVGVYCFESQSLFEALKEVKPNNRQNEYYLTDTIAILSKKNKVARSVLSGDRHEALGVNSPADLDKARQALDGRHDVAEFSE